VVHQQGFGLLVKRKDCPKVHRCQARCNRRFARPQNSFGYRKHHQFPKVRLEKVDCGGAVEVAFEKRRSFVEILQGQNHQFVKLLRVVGLSHRKVWQLKRWCYQIFFSEEWCNLKLGKAELKDKRSNNLDKPA